jgi:hypothetical protein
MMAEAMTDSKPQLPRGAYSKIARIHRVSPQMVRMVYLGKRKSARLERGIQRFVARMAEKAVA